MTGPLAGLKLTIDDPKNPPPDVEPVLPEPAGHHRLKIAQLLLSVLALGMIRPSYQDYVRYGVIFVMGHTIVLTGVLLWDALRGGSILRQQLPGYDWTRFRLIYATVVALILYCFGPLHFLGYSDYYYEIWNRMSACLTSLTGVLYAADAWQQLRVMYREGSGPAHARG